MKHIDERYLKAAEEYKQGEKVSNLIRRYNISSPYFYDVLEYLGVETHEAIKAKLARKFKELIYEGDPWCMYVLGYFVGDGGLTYRKGTYLISFVFDDNDVYEIVKSVLSHFVIGEMHECKVGNAIRLDLRSRWFYDTLFDLVIEREDTTRKGKGRYPRSASKIKKLLKLRNSEFFVAGLFDADGSISIEHKTRRIRARIGSTNYELLDVVREWLLSRGVKASLYTSNRAGYKPNARQYFHLNVDGWEMISRFILNVPFQSNKHWRKIEEYTITQKRSVS